MGVPARTSRHGVVGYLPGLRDPARWVSGAKSAVDHDFGAQQGKKQLILGEIAKGAWGV